jgi:hypothetical protein
MMALRLRLGLILCVGLAGCGGGPTQPPSNQPSNPNIITIMSGGIVSPKELTVSQGARVLFVNNDSRRHDMNSDPHPDHTDCPELNVGVLNPNQGRESQNLVLVRTCGFHDHDDADNNNLKGRIIIR